MLDGSLTVKLGFADGQSEMFEWRASNVSWAPTKIKMDIQGRQLSQITLGTNTTNGCYGTLAEPKVGEGARYGKVVNGVFTESEAAQLYVYQL
jgi:hypothetical protein